MDYNFILLKDANAKQVEELSKIIEDSFGYMFKSFSDDISSIGKCLASSLLLDKTYLCLNNQTVVAFISFSDNTTRAVKLNVDMFKKHFGKIKGFIFCKQLKGTFEKTKVTDTNSCYIDFIAVSKDYRKLGIGKEVLHYIHKKHFNTFYLDVLENNIPAKNLYLTSNYKEVRKEHSLIMKLGKMPPLIYMKYQK